MDARVKPAHDGGKAYALRDRDQEGERQLFGLCAGPAWRRASLLRRSRRRFAKPSVFISTGLKKTACPGPKRPALRITSRRSFVTGVYSSCANSSYSSNIESLVWWRCFILLQHKKYMSSSHRVALSRGVRKLALLFRVSLSHAYHLGQQCADECPYLAEAPTSLPFVTNRSR
jgi:hypothetical protein